MPEPHIEETLGNTPRPPMKVVRPIQGPRLNNKLLIVTALTTALIAGGALVGYGVSQLRGGEQRQTAQEIAKQREADELQAKQLAEKSQASVQASQETTITEGRIVSAHITNLKALRSEFDGIMDSLNSKAKSSASASREWDRVWAGRQANYNSRYAAVRAHNARERRRYQAGKVERANSAGRLVIKYTYRPRYQGYPPRPVKPTPMKVSVASEVRRLSSLDSQVVVVASSVASQTPAAQSFASVYPVLADAAQALGATVGDASTMARTVVVTKGAKGQIVDSAKISKVNQKALDAAFDELDRSFSGALTALGLSPEQVTSGGASIE